MKKQNIFFLMGGMWTYAERIRGENKGGVKKIQVIAEVTGGTGFRRWERMETGGQGEFL